ncbi:MAG: hypothetical protein NZ108_06625, partial [Bacteroidia bacterium]|nr:hypothetical protein [Bacteroidia bacterium]
MSKEIIQRTKFCFWFIILTLASSACGQTSTKQVSGLSYLLQPSKNLSTETPLIILLHGYGGNETNFLPLAEQLKEHYTIVCVRAPKAIGKEAFQWFDLQFQ